MSFSGPCFNALCDRPVTCGLAMVVSIISIQTVKCHFLTKAPALQRPLMMLMHAEVTGKITGFTAQSIAHFFIWKLCRHLK